MKIDIENVILPVGSVLGIRFNRSKFIVIGYGPIDKKTKKTYDYLVVPYPVGFYSFDNVMMINRSVVARVYYVGYSSKEGKKILNDISKQLKEKGGSENGK